MEENRSCKHCGVEGLWTDPPSLCNSCLEDGWFVCKECDRVQNTKEGARCLECTEFCGICEQGFRKEEVEFIEEDELIICPDCLADSKYRFCMECETWKKKGYRYGGIGSTKYVCEECLGENYNLCRDCGNVECVENLTTFNSELYCESCMDREDAEECEECGVCMSRSNVAAGDHCCPSTESDACYYSGTYKPRPIMHGKGLLQVGMELETDRYIEIPSVADFREYFDEQEMYVKEDASLTNGAELVFHPRDEGSWLGIKERLRDLSKFVNRSGGRSFNTTTCGVHLHLSKKAISETTLAKIIVTFIRFQNEIEKISQRRGNSYCEYKDLVEYTFDNTEKISKLYASDLENVLYKKVKGCGILGKYVAVNLSNEYTIEIRTFKGTLKPERLLSYIQFMVGLVDFLDHTTLRAVVENGPATFWADFRAFNREKRPEMVEYVSNRLGYGEVGENVPDIVQAEGG